MAQPVADASDTQIAGNSDRITFRLVSHSTKLADFEWFSILSNAPLHEKYRPFRVDFDKQSNDQKWQEKHNKPHKCHDAVEAPFEKESDPMLIFLHVA